MKHNGKGQKAADKRGHQNFKISSRGQTPRPSGCDRAGNECCAQARPQRRLPCSRCAFIWAWPKEAPSPVPPITAAEKRAPCTRAIARLASCVTRRHLPYNAEQRSRLYSNPDLFGVWVYQLQVATPNARAAARIRSQFTWPLGCCQNCNVQYISTM